MNHSLPIRSLNIPQPPQRAFASISSSLVSLLCRRQSDLWHLRTLSANNSLTPWRMDPFLHPLSYLAKALALTEDPIPAALRGEIRESLLAMEAEAEHLRTEIECNFWRAYFRTGRQREEEDLGRQREECGRRWVGLLQGWERECRRYYDPVRDPAEVHVTARLAVLGLE